MFPLTALTIKESIGKKILLAIFISATLFLLLILFFLTLDVVDGAKTYVQFLGIREAVENGKDTSEIISKNMKEVVTLIQAGIGGITYGMGIFLTLFATSDLFPSMIKKGYIDLIVSKPFSRTRLFNERVLGSLIIVSALILYIVVGSWLIISWKSGVWNYSFLLSSLMIIIIYSILYMYVLFFSLLTGNGRFGLIITYGMIVISPILLAREKLLSLLGNSWSFLFDTLYYIIPKVSHLGEIVVNLIRGKEINDFSPLLITIVGGVIMYFINLYIFNKKDF
ncbi:MAG: hypothetical protein CR982_07960 [Candidatus Cloacimonadota bacterium]|nr:MAG: hypothetical protein CR982_07960 [Candidatus Cloacimonadota bacterium]PIE77613.1 MAG: hypothetical protein CSA15_11860 [Candidatus Delongbacteria bacterium]